MNILVLGGGTSPEREVSLKSANSIAEALKRLGHQVQFVDPADGDERVLKAAIAADLVMPILHGPGGEDGEIQALLERTGKPYLGAGVEASQLCMNKVVIKKLLLENGMPTPKFAVVTQDMVHSSPLVKAPFVMKPIDDGSSVGLFMARKVPYDRDKVDSLFDSHHEYLIEELESGTEITVPVLGTEALPAIEIVPPAGEAFDFANKYNGETSELCPPLHVSQEVQEQARKLALKLHKLAGVRHLSRTDMIVRPDGSLVILEINTLPGMTANSLFPKGAAAAGLDFDHLVARLVELATAG